MDERDNHPAYKMDVYFEFLKKWRETWKGNDHLRGGQAFFNTLSDYRPDLAERLRGTDTDPFYNDDKLKVAYVWVAENWLADPPKGEK